VGEEAAKLLDVSVFFSKVVFTYDIVTYSCVLLHSFPSLRLPSLAEICSSFSLRNLILRMARKVICNLAKKCNNKLPQEANAVAERR